MRYILTGKEMRKLDNYTTDNIGIPSMVLMERAAMAVYEETKKHSVPEASVWILCGTGNNGADGIAVGRMLYEDGYRVLLILVGDAKKRTEEFVRQMGIAERLEVPIVEYRDFIPGNCDVVIDALLGTGISRTVDGEYEDALRMAVSMEKAYRISVDVPSGINADTGMVMGIAFQADMTVTFGYEKIGTAMYPGKEYAGRVIIADIGFPGQAEEVLDKPAYTMKPDDLLLVPERKNRSNKGTFGKVLVIAGSGEMCGAAYMSAMAAYRCGAGLVKVLTVKENAAPLHVMLPEAIIVSCSPEEIYNYDGQCTEHIQLLLRESDCVVAGPGLGKEPWVKVLLELIMRTAVSPLILDADALNMIAEYPELENYYRDNIVITPHPGEMGRLTDTDVNDVLSDLIGRADAYASEFHITCILKSAVTVIASEGLPLYINQSGDSSLAKAGSGDVLTGVIAGLVAIGTDMETACPLGVYIHGLAGAAAGRKKGKHSVLASDVLDALGEIVNRKMEESEGEYGL